MASVPNVFRNALHRVRLKSQTVIYIIWICGWDRNWEMIIHYTQPFQYEEVELNFPLFMTLTVELASKECIFFCNRFFFTFIFSFLPLR